MKDNEKLESEETLVSEEKFYKINNTNFLN